MLNELLVIQLLALITLFYFQNATNVLSLWYFAGIYLFSVGLLLLTDEADIFVGFLWVIDLGVGIVFVIFILHFSNFLHQKVVINLSERFLLFAGVFGLLLIGLFFVLGSPAPVSGLTSKLWFLLISHYDYYDLHNSYFISELQLLREIYFFHSSFEFFLINFLVFYGILSAILLSFLIKKIFSQLGQTQITNLNLLNNFNSTFFIRSQNFVRQQNTSTGTRVWTKNRIYSR